MGKILLTQKRALRTMMGVAQTESCRPIFIRLGILTVFSICILEYATYVHRNRASFISENNSVHSHNIREPKIHLRPHRLQASAVGTDVFGCKIYNELPMALKSICSVVKFKKELKERLRVKPYYSFNEYFDDSWL